MDTSTSILLRQLTKEAVFSWDMMTLVDRVPLYIESMSAHDQEVTAQQYLQSAFDDTHKRLSLQPHYYYQVLHLGTKCICLMSGLEISNTSVFLPNENEFAKSLPFENYTKEMRNSIRESRAVTCSLRFWSDVCTRVCYLETAIPLSSLSQEELKRYLYYFKQERDYFSRRYELTGIESLRDMLANEKRKTVAKIKAIHMILRCRRRLK